MGYYSIITLFKHEAFALCVDQKELGLAEIKPEEDLLGLHRNPDIPYGEDNWSIDPMDRGKYKRISFGYNRVIERTRTKSQKRF